MGNLLPLLAAPSACGDRLGLPSSIDSPHPFILISIFASDSQGPAQGQKQVTCHAGLSVIRPCIAPFSFVSFVSPLFFSAPVITKSIFIPEDILR